jgi:hypothetical protein
VVGDALTRQRPEATAADRTRDSSEGRTSAGQERPLAASQLGFLHFMRHEDLPLDRRQYKSKSRAPAGGTGPHGLHRLTPTGDDAYDAAPGAGHTPRKDTLRTNGRRLLGAVEGLATIVPAAASFRCTPDGHVSPSLTANSIKQETQFLYTVNQTCVTSSAGSAAQIE